MKFKKVLFFATLSLVFPLINSSVAFADLDVFENSINQQMVLIDKSLNTCPSDSSVEKKVRLQDTIAKNAKLYVLWSTACVDNGSIDTTTILMSIKSAGSWSTHTVAQSQFTYIDRNYLGAPSFINLGASGIAINWISFPEVGGGSGSKLVSKIFDGVHPENLLSQNVSEIAQSSTCGIGTVVPFYSNSGSQLIYITNNGGTDACMGDIYSTTFSAGQWSVPQQIVSLNFESDLSKNQLAIDPSDGSIYICINSGISPRPSNPSNSLKVISNKGGTWHIEINKTYSDITQNSSFSCSLAVDQNQDIHLLYGEASWTRRVTDSGGSINLNVNSIKYNESILQSSEWVEVNSKLDEINSSLGLGFQNLEFCANCLEKLTLLSTSEGGNIRIYELSEANNWVRTRDFNDEYNQNVQSIRDVWGSSASGYTFLLMDMADELLGKFSWQKGYALDWKPTFSPPDGSHVLFSDTTQNSARSIYLENYGSIIGRFASGEVLRAGNSIVEIWEDGGTEDTPGKTILVEQIIKNTPSCTDDSNFVPGKVNALTATSSYTTAILNFQSSYCGTVPTQAVVEVEDISSGLTREVVFNSIPTTPLITGLSPGNSYSFKIKFLNSNGSSVFSKSSNVLAIQSAPVPSIPTQVQNIEPPVEIQKTENSPQTQKSNTAFFASAVLQSLKRSGLQINRDVTQIGSASTSIDTSINLNSKSVQVRTTPNKYVQLKFNILPKSLARISLLSAGKTITLLTKFDTAGKSILLPGIKFPKGKHQILAKLQNGQTKRISIYSN